MPHKKNPDVLEIVRAKYHQIVAFEFEIKNNIANLISGYNRDIQLTKKPVICGFEVTKNTIQIMIKVLDQLKVNEKNCKNAMTKELFTTEKVYSLLKKDIPFREAYKKASKEMFNY